MSGNKALSTSQTKLEALQLQSSSYGVTIPVVYGQNRIAGNLLWYGGFQAHAHTSSAGGKGGGGATSTDYTYSASILMGICEGPIIDVPTVWRGQKQYTGGYNAAQFINTSENFTIPIIGGSITVSQASNYVAPISVIIPGGGGDNGGISIGLQEGLDYTRSGGTYTFNAGSQYAGYQAVITYKYTVPQSFASALSQIGASLKTGQLGQSTWAYLNSFAPIGGAAGDNAVPYSGIAYAYAQDYDLGSSAQVGNHNFEVRGFLAYSVSSSKPDADPALVGFDITTNSRYGASLPVNRIQSVDLWSSYVRASGLLLSPALETQEQASSVLQRLADLTNTGIVWSNGVLKFIPYGDQALTANGATYTPNNTEIYDLTEDHFLPIGDDPVEITRKSLSDCYNHVRIEFKNRANQYQTEIAEAKDQTSIDSYRVRTMPTVTAHWICDADVAGQVAQLLLQRELYIKATYKFMLPANFALLEPMDLLTLTVTAQFLDKVPVRIIEIEESDDSDDGRFTITAEDFPAGVSHAPTYTLQTGLGFSHNFNADPGNVLAPTIFEAPVEKTVNGLELYVAVAGLGQYWGGCKVWMSLDGVNYKNVGSMNGGSRYGKLSGSISGGALPVVLNAGQLLSGSAQDQANNATLCYVGGAIPEYLSYQTATLTGMLAYNLSSLNRAQYYIGSASYNHAANDPFVRVDDAIFKTGELDLTLVGTTVYFKFTSFNIYGGGDQSIADVTPYQYTIVGNSARRPPPAPAALAVTQLNDGTRRISVTLPSSLANDVVSVLVRYASGTSITWATATYLREYAFASAGAGGVVTFDTPEPQAAGTYSFEARLVSDRRDIGASGAQALAVVLNSAGPPTSTLTNDSVTLAASTSGAVSDFSAAVTQMRVFVGGVDDTANWSYSKADTGCTSALTGTPANICTVSAMSADTAYVDITASKSGYPSQTKRFSLSKARAGVAGTPGTPGTNGNNGQRGSMTFYLSGHTAWVEADATTAASVLGGPILNDVVTEYGTNFSQTRFWSGSAWVVVAQVIDGNLLVNGTVGANSIAANAITASKMAIGNQDSVIPDPGFYDAAWWNIASRSYISKNDGGPYQPVKRFIRISANSQTGAHDVVSTSWFPIELGASYRLKIRLFISTDFVGGLDCRFLRPWQSWDDFGTPVVSDSAFATGYKLDVSTITKGAWKTYERIVTNSSTLQNNSGASSDTNAASQLLFDVAITAGYIELAFEIVRVTDNALIVNGAVTADKISVTQLSAITATIGTLQSSTSGQRSKLTDSGLQVYNASNVEVVTLGVF